MIAAAARAAARQLARRRAVIVAGHGVGPPDPTLDPSWLRVHPDRFRAQLDLLASAGFRFVTVAELVERTGAAAAPPRGLAAISFDDGMLDNHSVARSILDEFGAPATVYVATGYIGRPNPFIKDGSRMMSSEELLDLAAAGWELGAHTVTHPDLSKLGYDECLDEMRRSREHLEELTGAPVRTFAYPFCRYGPAALAAARDAGFSAAVTCGGAGSWRRYEMKRAIVTGKDGLPSFVLKLADLYQPLFKSAPGRALRVSTRTLRARAGARLHQG